MKLVDGDVLVQADELLTNAALIRLVAAAKHFESLLELPTGKHALKMFQFEHIIQAVCRSSALTQAVAFQIEILPQIDHLCVSPHAR